MSNSCLPGLTVLIMQRSLWQKAISQKTSIHMCFIPNSRVRDAESHVKNFTCESLLTSESHVNFHFFQTYKERSLTDISILKKCYIDMKEHGRKPKKSEKFSRIRSISVRDLSLLEIFQVQTWSTCEYFHVCFMFELEKFLSPKKSENSPVIHAWTRSKP